MNVNKIVEAVQSPAIVEKAASAIQPAVLSAFEKTGKPGKTVKNFLHGTWLGHPLHPILTDIPIGAYTVTTVLDMVELCGDDSVKNGADASLAVGLAGAMGSAVTGITDWTGTSGQNRRIGMVHAALNVGATLLNVASLTLRRKRSTRNIGIGLSFASYAVTAFSAYLGGHLVYGQQMGVDHTAGLGVYPLNFTNVYRDEDLKEGEMVCAKAGEIPVLLVRKNRKIYALVNTCSHLGGPLNEGELLNNCVKCPWHGSVFSLETGDVIEGPATEAQPKFDTRVRNGMIQVRLSEKEAVKRIDAMNQSS